MKKDQSWDEIFRELLEAYNSDIQQLADIGEVGRIKQGWRVLYKLGKTVLVRTDELIKSGKYSYGLWFVMRRFLWTEVFDYAEQIVTRLQLPSEAQFVIAKYGLGKK
jgi:hypothetical protein